MGGSDTIWMLLNRYKMSKLGLNFLPKLVYWRDLKDSSNSSWNCKFSYLECHENVIEALESLKSDVNWQDEGLGSIRMRRHGGLSPTRSSSYVQSFKGMNFNMAMGRLSLGDESESSSSSNTRKYSRTSPLQSRAIKTTGRPSFTTNGSGENLGV